MNGLEYINFLGVKRRYKKELFFLCTAHAGATETTVCDLVSNPFLDKLRHDGKAYPNVSEKDR